MTTKQVSGITGRECSGGDRIGVRCLLELWLYRNLLGHWCRRSADGGILVDICMLVFWKSCCLRCQCLNKLWLPGIPLLSNIWLLLLNIVLPILPVLLLNIVLLFIVRPFPCMYNSPHPPLFPLFLRLTKG